MKKKMRTISRKVFAMVMATAVAAGSFMVMPKEAAAENPVIQVMYTADPAPLVVGDTLYLYTTRDELKEQAYDDWSYMNEWRCFATKDMVNWTDMGQIAHAQTFDKVSKNEENWRAWAHQVVEMPVQVDGGKWEKKYFLFAPFNGTKIDVAVADNPWGPFEDATPGKFLIDGGWGGGNIDPTIYIEDHGNPDDYANYDVYMYWGNPYIRYCKLTNDMVDVDPDLDGDGVLSEEENTIDKRFSNEDNKILGEVRPGLHSYQTYGDEGYAQFGEPSQGAATTGKFPMEPEGSEQKRCAFEEGPWVLKHEDGNPDTDDYFMYFVGGRTPGETVEYSTAPTPLGPWTYQALLMPREYGSCIHPGFAEFKGKNYIFYLNDRLVGGDGSNRSVCVKEFEYDENNLFVKQTDDDEEAYILQKADDPQRGQSYFSVDPVGTLDPYVYNEAETICWTSNLDGAEGGFNGTGRGVKTKARAQCYDIDEVTGKEAFWKSAALYGVVVSDIDHNDYIKVREVDFGEKGPIGLKVTAACGEGSEAEEPFFDSNGIERYNPEATTVGGNIEVWVDYGTDDEKQIGTVQINNTGGTNEYKDFEIDITEKVTGVHDLYYIFTGLEGTKLFNFESWQFETVAPEPTETPAPAVTPAPATPAPGVTPTPAPEKVTVKAPAIKKAKAGSKKVKLTFSKVKGAKGYVVYMATKKNGKYTKKVTVKANKSNVTIKKLKKGKKYFFKMKAYKVSNGKKIYSNFSKVKKVTVK